MTPNCRAMTLVEVMMALLITSMIGAVTTSVTVALFNAHDSTDAYAENVQSARMSLTQLQSLIGSARLVTEGDETTMTLWAFDAADPGVINCQEVVRLRFDEPSGTIQQIYFEFPDGLPADIYKALNAPLTLNETADWNVASNVLGFAGLHDTVIATGVSSVRFRYDTNPPFSRLVAVEATFGEGRQAVAHRTAMSLRAPLTKWITVDHQVYLLNVPVAMQVIP